MSSGKRTLRQVTDNVWLVVEEISEVLIPETDGAIALVIVMNNGNGYEIPRREGVTAETMIRNLFSGGHE